MATPAARRRGIAPNVPSDFVALYIIFTVSYENFDLSGHRPELLQLFHFESLYSFIMERLHPVVSHLTPESGTGNSEALGSLRGIPGVVNEDARDVLPLQLREG